MAYKKPKKDKFDVFPKSSKGVSVMIGYVLLVAIAIVIGTLTYQWVITYLPRDSLECPSGTSLIVDEVICQDEFLNLTVENSGRFNIGGYFIHATNETDQELATIDLSGNIIEGGTNQANAIIFVWHENSMKPTERKKSLFNLTSHITSIEIIPIRFEVIENKKRFVSCGDAKIKEPIVCGGIIPGEIVPDVCGNGAIVSPEECDTGNLNGETCTSVNGIGWTGNLSCYPAGYAQECRFNTTECIEEIGIQESIVFISSTSFDGNLGGISGADAECNNLASTAGLSGTFVAWLSDSTTNAKDRIPQDIPFKRVIDGATIANNLADLLDGFIDNPINVDEIGNTGIDEEVWTGTDEFGIMHDQRCENWESNLNTYKGRKGKSKEIDKKWTNEKDKECNNLRRIYCFQIS